MTSNELLEQILTVCPMADIGYDNDGQIIVYTNLMDAEEGNELVEYEPLNA